MSPSATVADLQQSLDGAQEQVRQLTAAVAEKAGLLEMVQAELAASSSTKESLITGLLADLEQSKADQLVKGDVIVALETKAGELSQERDGLLARIAALSSDQKTQMDAMLAKTEMLTTEQVHMQKTIDTATTQAALLQSQLEQANQTNLQMENDRLVLVEKVKELEIMIAQEAARKAEPGELESLAALQASVDEKSALVADLSKQLDSTVQQRDHFEKQCQELQANITFAEEEQASTSEMLQKTLEDSTALQASYEALQAQTAQSQTTIAELRSEISQHDEKMQT
ncbi:hypothetical protein HDU91_004358, partial [Kappamyces sp. JEL0680]